MARTRSWVRPILALAGLGLAAAVALVLLGAIPPGAGEKPSSPGAAMRAARPAEVRAAVDGAAAALRARDRAAYAAALPVSGDAARRAVDQLYRNLAPLPWSELRLVAEPVAGTPGRYHVRAAGDVGGADPSDRIVAERVLSFGVLSGRIVVRDDHTPEDLARRYVMAFRRPVAVCRHACIVIADRSERARAEDVARACGPARRRLRLLGISSREPIVIYYYASRDELRAALAGGPSERRIVFFSRVPERLSPAYAETRDIGVLGPALDGKDAWLPRMLAHELTHAYTVSWFAKTEHAPTLLAEGLATAVEGGRSFALLRDDLSSGKSALPLAKAIATDDLWQGNPMRTIRLAYLEGASLVLYVLHRWGLMDLRRFVTAVSNSDLTRKGVAEAVRESFGLSWGEFYAGWVDYVQALP